MIAYNLTVQENVLQDEMYYKDQIILTYTIKYPQFYSDHFKVYLRRLNQYYRTQAIMYQKIQIKKLNEAAVSDYEYSVANDFPIHQYEVVIDYTITYNENCTLSLYFDRYEYTGGAHGITYRTSDTWDLLKGKKLNLEEFFPDQKDFINFIQNEINRQIATDIKNATNMYFEDYVDLVKENFNSKNFYLTDTGVVIYYQLYEIAPYVSGIQTFTIPFSEVVEMPKC